MPPGHKHENPALHRHTPYLGWIGRKVGNPPGRPRVATRIPIQDNLTFSLVGHAPPPLGAGVSVDQSFVDYVPRLGDLHDGAPGSLRREFVTRTITIPTGTIRTREFIKWDWHGNTPSKIAYMDTNVQGFAANEVVVDVGDDR